MFVVAFPFYLLKVATHSLKFENGVRECSLFTTGVGTEENLI